MLTPVRTFAHPGEPVTYTARAVDADGDDLGDVTPLATVTITFSAGANTAPRPDGACTATTCTADRYGRHTITGAAEVDGATLTGTAALQVVPRIRWRVPLDRLATVELTPASSVVEVDGERAYTATGYDSDHRLLGDVTAVTAFEIGPDGSCAGATCTSGAAGPHTVTGTVDVRGRLVTGTASLLVVPRLSGLLVDPARAIVEVGHGIRYTTTGLDAVGRPVVDLTAWAHFTVGPDGACDGATCTPTAVGDHTVTAAVDLGAREVSGHASLRAIPEVSGLRLLPAGATLTAGDEVTFTIQGLDAGGNPVVDLTDEAVVRIAPDGSCDGAACTATRAGSHTVTATVVVGDREVTGSVPLTVAAGPPATLTVSPAGDLTAGERRSFHAVGEDAFGNPTGDLTAVTTFDIDPDGSCSDGLCTATRAGAHTVTGTVQLAGGTVRGSVTLDVVAAATAALTVTPAGPMTAGRSREYTATGVDEFGNPTGDVTSRTTFTITPDGGCTGATCTAAVPGVHTVTGSLEVGGRTVTGSVDVDVADGSPVPAPSPAPTPADRCRPVRPRSDQRSDPAAPPAGPGDPRGADVRHPHGGCTTGIPRSRRRRDRRVRRRGHRQHHLHDRPGRLLHGRDVHHHQGGPAHRHGVGRPGRSAGQCHAVRRRAAGSARPAGRRPARCGHPGQQHRFDAVGSDAWGNPLDDDVATRTTFRIEPDGSCRGATCTATRLGPHTVTGTVSAGGTSVTGRGALLVLSEPVVTLRLNPRTAVVPKHGKVTHTATGLDSAGRAVVDLTDYTRFSMTTGGSCSGATCTSTDLGEHAVVGTTSVAGRTITGRATVRVTAADPVGTPGGDLAGLELNPRSAVVDTGVPLTYLAVGLDADGVRLGDVSVRTRLTISPDGTCSGTTCTAATPGAAHGHRPHRHHRHRRRPGPTDRAGCRARHRGARRPPGRAGAGRPASCRHRRLRDRSRSGRRRRGHRDRLDGGHLRQPAELRDARRRRARPDADPGGRRHGHPRAG